MPEEALQAETPVSTPAQEPAQETETPLTSSDILKKANESTEPTVDVPTVEVPEKMFDREDLAKIEDPVARKMVEDVLAKQERDMVKGMNSKFQELSEIRKVLEDKAKESNSWDAQKLRDAMKDPKFIELVQLEAQQQQAQTPPQNYDGSNEEWSNLSDAEQSRIRSLESKMSQLLSTQERLEIQRADERIKEKLVGYDPKQIDSFQEELKAGKFSQGELRELIGKSLLFDQAVEKAYNYGLAEKGTSVQEKLNANSEIDSVQANASRDIPERKEGVKSKEHFSNIANNILQKLGQSK